MCQYLVLNMTENMLIFICDFLNWINSVMMKKIFETYYLVFITVVNLTFLRLQN